MTLGPALSGKQIDQIILCRRRNIKYRDIAAQVGCTVHQAKHYWRVSEEYKPLPMGAPPALRDDQIRQIVQDRLAKLSYKRIAVRANCTPEQAVYYWRKSAHYLPNPRSSASARIREAGKKTAVQREATKTMQRIEQERRAIEEAARQQLKDELQAHQAEKSEAPLYQKGRPLVW